MSRWQTEWCSVQLVKYDRVTWMQATCTVAILAQGTTHGPMRSRRPFFAAAVRFPPYCSTAVSAACFATLTPKLPISLLCSPCFPKLPRQVLLHKKSLLHPPANKTFQKRTFYGIEPSSLPCPAKRAPTTKTSVIEAFCPTCGQEAHKRHQRHDMQTLGRSPLKNCTDDLDDQT